LELVAKENGNWNWLQNKMKKIISNWSHRWLTLGGRLTLVKSFLEIIPIYWLELAKIPIIILNKIRIRMFCFLWTRKK
jgi:hypothetical protein